MAKSTTQDKLNAVLQGRTITKVEMNEATSIITLHLNDTNTEGNSQVVFDADDAHARVTVKHRRVAEEWLT